MQPRKSQTIIALTIDVRLHDVAAADRVVVRPVPAAAVPGLRPPRVDTPPAAAVVPRVLLTTGPAVAALDLVPTVLLPFNVFTNGGG